MLRFSLLALLIANAGYLAWSQGWMATLGWAPENQSEPYRLKQQVRPDVLSVLSSPAPASPAAPGVPAEPSNLAPTSQVAAPRTPEPVEEVLPETTVCLQTDAMDEAQAKTLQLKLQNSDLPPSSWESISNTTAGRWMVYLGKFPNETALEKRRVELRTRKIAYDRAGGNLELGLSLGRFSSEEAATRELGHMLNQGVRGARVVQERVPQTLYTVRLSQSTSAQRHMLQTLQPTLAGTAFRACNS
jgi:hypothetical protein